MPKDNNIFTDMAKLANSALATTANMKNEMTRFIKSQIESFIKSMNFVERKEFDVLKKMVMQNTLAIEKLTGKKCDNIKSSTASTFEDAVTIKKSATIKKSVKPKSS